MAKKQAVKEQEVAPEATAPAAEAPNFTLQDLITVAQVIQLSSTRGAFRAEELQQVGALYNKLVGFLQATGALTPAAEAPTEEKQNA